MLSDCELSLAQYKEMVGLAGVDNSYTEVLIFVILYQNLSDSEPLSWAVVNEMFVSATVERLRNTDHTCLLSGLIY